ncbi:MAG: alpha/beta hydrolase, partial [Verrucomicrobiota bacterium]
IADFGRALAEMRTSPAVDPERIILHGRSLGGAVVAAVASFEKPKVLILESTFIHAAAASRYSLMWPFMIPDRWRSRERLTGYEGETLILQGTRDFAIPRKQGRSFHAHLRNSRLVFLNGAGHRLQDSDRESYWKELRTFLLPLDCWEDA